MLIGGRVRVILTGGAPLSPETHDYIRLIFRIFFIALFFYDHTETKDYS